MAAKRAGDGEPEVPAVLSFAPAASTVGGEPTALVATPYVSMLPAPRPVLPVP